ncbi:sigma-70-like protein [Actinomadura pelletieri DSM 43383]|uniref:Sigma-70-like protein n=1 Tax=Actinomadura pelletieri DSM 43383 TaxID=1120940 RepID=A0A495R0E5_9ACTN|nr:sigma factor [Actinomadura pelletieri]RKS79807.1 sigma-70-like protein [Actinomadura pelletieri DSM 43383]
MPGSPDETYRPLMFSIAYGMTGSVGDAEDIVQDAFLGLTRARRAGTTIIDPKAYLTTAVTRLGINHLSSARVRRETYVGDWLPEPVVVPADAPGPDPDDPIGEQPRQARPPRTGLRPGTPTNLGTRGLVLGAVDA